MNYFSTFDISAAGMGVERLRLDATAMNLANANTTRGPDGTVFKRLQVVEHSDGAATFDSILGAMQGDAYSAVSGEIVQVDTPPKMVFDPGHPDADQKGFVAYPDINPVTEMVNLITITRAYEANVRAMNAAKTMALKALEIGG